MKNYFIIGVTGAVTGLLMSLGVASAAEHEGAKTKHPDQHFMQEAAQGGQAEVALGQMAAKQAANEDVKKFGQRMVDDHSKLNGDLAKVAQQKGMTVPQTLDKKHQEELDKLAKRGGVDFDKEYMSKM